MVLLPQFNPEFRRSGMAHAVGQALPHGDQEDKGKLLPLRQVPGKVYLHADGSGVLDKLGKLILLRRIFVVIFDCADCLPQQLDRTFRSCRSLVQQNLPHRRQRGSRLVVVLRLGREHLFFPGQDQDIVRKALEGPGDLFQLLRLLFQLPFPFILLGEVGKDHFRIGGSRLVRYQRCLVTPDPSVREQIGL